jgi:hypothetical protein
VATWWLIPAARPPPVLAITMRAVVRTATAKEVTAGKRLYRMIGEDLAYAFDMAAVGQPLQPHLSAQLKRVASALEM